MSEPNALDVALGVFTEELARWGGRMNLVGSTGRAGIARHIADSLAAAQHLPVAARVVDLGSGAGFPGVPLALARPDLQVVLVEIREKRIAFLRHIARQLGLRLDILAASIEAPPAATFDFALLRAVAKPERSLELGIPWVGPNGEVWIWASPTADLPGATALALSSGGKILRLRAADFSRGTV